MARWRGKLGVRVSAQGGLKHSDIVLSWLGFVVSALSLRHINPAIINRHISH